jgi:hypothetical protein
MNFDPSAIATGIATIIASVGTAFIGYATYLSNRNKNDVKELKKEYKEHIEQLEIKHKEYIKMFEAKLKVNEVNYLDTLNFLRDRVVLLEAESKKMDEERSGLITSRSETLKANEKIRLEVEKIKTDYLKQIKDKDMIIQEKTDYISKLEGRIEILEATVKELQEQLNQTNQIHSNEIKQTLKAKNVNVKR